jgi:hypothetical protein
MSLNGIIHIEIREGSFATKTFKQFIQETLRTMNNWPEQNSVLVMDNAKIHKHPNICHMIFELEVFYENISLYAILTSYYSAAGVWSIFLHILLITIPWKRLSAR